LVLRTIPEITRLLQNPKKHYFPIMTSFDSNSYFQGQDDERYDISKRKVLVDVDTAETIQKEEPAVQRATPNFNSTTAETAFDISGGGNTLENLSAWNLLITMQFGEALVGAPTTITGNWGATGNMRMGIPWCFSWLIQNISVYYNGSSTATETHTGNDRYSYAAMLRLQQKYDRTRLEQMSESNFTPVFEDKIDTNVAGTGMSTQTAARHVELNALTSANRKTLSIPFCDLLACFDTPAFASNINRLRMEIVWRDPDAIGWTENPIPTHNPVCFITDCRIIRISELMTPQQNIDTNMSRTKGKVERFTFNYFTVHPTDYTTNSQVSIPSHSNVQSSAAGFRAIDYTAINQNPMQFVRGAITDFQMEYDSISIPRKPANVATTRTIAYTYLKQAIKKACTRQSTPAVPANYFTMADSPTFFMWLGVADTIFPKMTFAAKDIKWNINGAAPAVRSNVWVFVEKERSIQIASDNSVAVNN
jgi:hypothetical protein